MASSKTIVVDVKPEITVEGTDLVIRCREVGIAQGRPSASGKTKVLASTRGNVYLSELDCNIGLNVYRK